MFSSKIYYSSLPEITLRKREDYVAFSGDNNQKLLYFNEKDFSANRIQVDASSPPKIDHTQVNEIWAKSQVDFFAHRSQHFREKLVRSFSS